MQKLPLIALSALLSACAGLQKTAETPRRLEPLPLELRSTVDDFTVLLDRRGGLPRAQELIEVAEELKPSGAESWWHEVADGTAVPWAVTGDALRYYLEKIESIRQSKRSGGLIIYSAALRYTATVAAEPDDGLALVTLTLDWEQFCGSPLCGMAFRKVRTVAFAPDGEVVEIFGDGPSEHVFY